MMSRIKLDRPDDSTGAPESDSNEFICLYCLLCEHVELQGISYGLYIEFDECSEERSGDSDSLTRIDPQTYSAISLMRIGGRVTELSE